VTGTGPAARASNASRTLVRCDTLITASPAEGIEIVGRR
jgi:hypothetical protein